MATATNAHWDRRRFLQLGGLGLFGLTLPQLLQLESSARAASKKDRPRSCIFLLLFGGPSQIDIWDMKPDAPDDPGASSNPLPRRCRAPLYASTCRGWPS